MYASLQNIQYLLHEVHKAAELGQYPYYSAYNRETMDMVLQSAKDLADTEMYPYYVEMDQYGVHYEHGTLRVHPHLRRIIEKGAESGWVGSTTRYEHGGSQMPEVLFNAATHFFHAANNGVVGYITLTTGASRLITSFGAQHLIDTYIPKMFGGQWQGTMALTEPQAGSSLSDVKTSAKPTGNAGTYLISGQKIYISAGDHTCTENVVHLLLARIEGAPAGTKGISLFVVPKLRPTPSGDLVPNNVTTAGNYGKIGQKTYTTTHLMFGEQGPCEGYLVGEPHRGLAYMFQMMNEARIGVGLTAASIATAAYYASLKYANERPQGRRLNEKDTSLPPTLIINHPDVRRMLFFQKAVVESSLSLIFECAKLQDLVHVEAGTTKERANLLLEILIPVCKTYPSEYGIQSVSAGLQTLGGAGYCYDFPLQQHYRDIRIAAIYEGTTGIQSLDLLGRKVTMQDGAAARVYLETVSATIAEAAQFASLKPYCDRLTSKLGQLQQVVGHLMAVAKRGDQAHFLADATLFMEYFSLITMGWQWLKMALVSEQAISAGATGDAAVFHKSKVHTMRFYFHYELPKTEGLATRLLEMEYLTLPTDNEELLM
jgi:alkylation response protein AidB-like acyl-CoA dehydrogenase